MNIETRNIIKTYQEKTVLNLEDKNRNLLFGSGKIHGIIGPNGSGKTTLMKIMAGLIAPSAGDVLYNGQSLDQDILSVMTYSTHTPTLFSRSVYENIAYPLKIRKRDKDEIHQIVSQLLEEFEIDDIRDQSARHLSGGEAQKTALARALSFSPQVLFLDEPTANIDPKSIQIIEAALQKRNCEQGLSIIIITHNLSQAFRICNHLTFLDQGSCLFSDTPEKIMASDHPIIDEFISFNRF
ncbi:ABC transporter ATP-binding protein [Acetobacterium sp.]|jgi:tungstate transport system ATP-binding protein|uniref:ABC transporter ATP-binding protein n=1 Tax=Acetobacterium sp. TaxID=1872094 RepID=UPI002718C849|nr:ABC transporter ATP-binding protein [Acetobacterium sp.]MDO9493396.1 ABC transporter ATP-binding protein [Acetobacterium sp.]